MESSSLEHNILILEDRHSVFRQLFNSISLDKYIIHSIEKVNDAIAKLKSIDPAVVIVSVEKPGMEGMDLINYIKKHQLPIAVIAISHDHSAEVSASAIRAGATDFLRLPCSEERLIDSIEQSLGRMSHEHRSNSENPLFNESEFGFIGAGQSMLEVSKLIISAAKSDASVFITGENGTGKEVCAQLIHRLSKRRENQLVPLNCAAIPHSLAESEVFGHMKGAFTGAYEDRQGVASLADKGTLFLDEIGEMEMDLQSKLLRFVQTGTFNRVGSAKLENVDVRFICATNREPHQQIEQNQFREDLFYRLNVIQIHLPPLRNRGDDVLVFARNFLASAAKAENKRFQGFTTETEALLKEYSWPGNVRELQNVIRSIVVLHDGDMVIPSMLPMAIIREKGERRRRASDRDGASSRQHEAAATQEPIKQANAAAEESHQEVITAEVLDKDIIPLDTVVEQTISRAIAICDGNVVEAATRLGVSPSTLYRKLRKKTA